jgi:hypothetical protein
VNITEVDKLLNEMWEALKNENCAHPPTAVRVSMLSPQAFKKSMKKFAEQLVEARELVKELDDPDDCWYDHHGLCQTHSLHEKPCPHERAKELK